MSEEFTEATFMRDISAMLLSPLCWIGNQLNLYEHLASCSDGVNYDEFAKISNCNERYLREWLHAMTCAGWVKYDSETKKFTLSEILRPFLVKGEENKTYVSDVFKAIQIFNEAAPNYINCFKNGGGLTLDQIHPKVGDAVEAFTGPSQKYLVPSLIAEHVKDIHELLEQGITVADVGCGVGL